MKGANSSYEVLIFSFSGRDQEPPCSWDTYKSLRALPVDSEKYITRCLRSAEIDAPLNRPLAIEAKSLTFSSTQFPPEVTSEKPLSFLERPPLTRSVPSRSTWNTWFTLL